MRVILEGFAGDRHAGVTKLADNRTPFYPRGTVIGNSRQVWLVSAEELAEIAAALGVPRISTIPPPTRLFFPDEATLLVTAQNFPCVFPGKAVQQQYPEAPGLDRLFPKHAYGLRGLVAWVEQSGTIREGDPVRIALAETVPCGAPPPEC